MNVRLPVHLPASVSPDTAGLTFSGYASLFNVADLSGDVMLPSAFRRSLSRRGAGGVKMLYQHDPTIILGQWLQVEEDAVGLRVSGQFAPEVEKAREVESLVRAGILDGLSIGFRTVTARSDAKSGLRRVSEVDLWEVSIVTFPMLPGARIGSTGGEGKGQSLSAEIASAATRLRAATVRGETRGGGKQRTVIGSLPGWSRTPSREGRGSSPALHR